jgi:hypothetical protein
MTSRPIPYLSDPHQKIMHCQTWNNSSCKEYNDVTEEIIGRILTSSSSSNPSFVHWSPPRRYNNKNVILRKKRRHPLDHNPIQLFAIRPQTTNHQDVAIQRPTRRLSNDSSISSITTDSQSRSRNSRKCHVPLFITFGTTFSHHHHRDDHHVRCFEEEDISILSDWNQKLDHSGGGRRASTTTTATCNTFRDESTTPPKYPNRTMDDDEDDDKDNVKDWAERYDQF